MDPGKLLVLARRRPACSICLNVRVTVALRELLQETAEPELPIGTVVCKAYHPGRAYAAKLVEVTATDVHRARKPWDAS